MNTPNTIDENTRRVICALEFENVQKISAVRLKKMDPRVNVISGRNGAGKSSFLLGIAMALAGRRAAGPNPIRDDELEATTFLDLGDITITRKIKRNGNDSLTVKPKGGRAITSPQALLDVLTKKTCFDPLRFVNEEPAKQAEILRQVTGLDFTEIDADITRIFAERTDNNREVRAQEVKVSNLRSLENVPEKKVSTSDIEEKIGAIDRLSTAAKAIDDKVTAARLKLQRYRDALTSRNNDLVAVRQRIGELEKMLEAARYSEKALTESISTGTTMVSEADKECTRIEKEAEAAHAAVPDASKLFAELQQRRADNALFDEAAAQQVELARLRTLRETSDEMTRSIEHLEKKKKAMLKEAKLPVPGLSFTSAGVFLNEQPFVQASDAEKIRTSVAISAAQNPMLPVMFVRQGALLDDESMNVLIACAEEHDLQLIVERVKRDKFTSIEIEEGELVE